MRMRFPIIKILSLVLLLFLVATNLAHAINIWEGTTGWNAHAGLGCNSSDQRGGCSFCDGLKVIKNIIRYLFEAAIPISVAMIVYGAIRLTISGGNENMVSEAKKIISGAVIGLIIALSSWTIINTILQVLSANAGGSVNFPWNDINCTNPPAPFGGGTTGGSGAGGTY